MEKQHLQTGTSESSVISSGLEAQQSNATDPTKWSSKKKIFVASVYCLAMCNSSLSSSLPGGASLYIRDHFSISSPTRAALPTSVFLLGWTIGPLVFAPLSERVGRKPMILSSFTLFTLASLGCALSPSFTAFICFRVIAGATGGSPVSLIGGVYSDIYADARVRGRATALYTVVGAIPVSLGPTLSGYVSLISWRWSFHLSTILAGCNLLLLFFVPETYAPVLQRRHSGSLDTNQASGSSFTRILATSFLRPVKMLCTELIVICATLYISLAFAVLFLFFQAYPFIFRGIYNMSPPTAGLAFIPIGSSTVIAAGLFFWWDSRLYHAKARGEPWAFKEEYQRLPLACGSGPLLSCSIFWLAWASRVDFHWIVPMLAGLPFGVAYILTFIVFFNYLTDAYKVSSASAMAAASCGRSVASALLVLAADSMYEHLGSAWATSVPGFASLLMIPIPFVLIRYGAGIRARSKICQDISKATLQSQGNGRA